MIDSQYFDNNAKVLGNGSKGEFRYHSPLLIKLMSFMQNGLTFWRVLESILHGCVENTPK